MKEPTPKSPQQKTDTAPQPEVKKKEPIVFAEKSVPKVLREKVTKSEKGEIISESYPYDEKLDRKSYEEEKKKLQIELLKMQRWVKETGQRVVLLFEGRDAAGKGGTIKRFMEHMNPRGARIVALDKPTEAEKGQWYFQRYIPHLPAKGEIVFFDRSWYNRAVVEPVMGFCSSSQHQKFLREVPLIENMLINDGILFFKFWFSVSREEQFRRFNSRAQDTLKQWKLSPVDMKSLEHWNDYTRAKEAMFAATDTAGSPWIVVKSDDKKRARINCMRFVLAKLPYPNKDTDAAQPPDPKIVGAASDMYENADW